MNNLGKNWYLYIPVVLLLVAILNLEYGYYEMLRVVIAVFALFFAFKLNAIKQNGLMIVMIVIAIVFNPISPIHSEKGIWILIDIVSAIVFLVSSAKIIEAKK